MKKRNLILIALAISLVLVFTQLNAMAVPGQCIITPGVGCGSSCPPEDPYGSSCNAGGSDCNAVNYWNCCSWAMRTCNPDKIFDKTECGDCCDG